MLTVGIDGASCRAALAAAEDFPQVYAAVGRHPNSARGFDDADLAELRALAAHGRCRRSGRRVLTSTATTPRAATSSAPSRPRSRSPRELGKPLVIHTREAARETLDQLAAEADGVSVVMHCFSMPEQLERVPASAATGSRSPATSPTRSAGELAAAAARVPQDRLLVETDAPYLTPQPVRKHRNQPAFVAHTVRFLAELRGVEEAAARRGCSSSNAARVFGWT